MQELPLTLKDAIEVTRRMGLKYLWVDSICILQGSDDAAQADWLLESSRMRDYYKCCDFCIAADDASSDEDGFLSIKRTQRAKVPVSMSLAHWRRADSCVIYLQADLNPGLRTTFGLFKNTFFLHALYTTDMNKFSGIANFGGSPSRMRWYSLVNEYAARALTFETNRLFTLAALVQEIEAQSGVTYWVGIWAEDAHADLLWRTCLPVKISAAYIAPSWSWASRDISSFYDTANFGNYPVDGWKLDSSLLKANIASCEIITVDGTLNGRLLNAKLTLRTRCLDSNQWESL
ncbi:hypothetical protein BOTNAR_0006g00300 [Botryotinia narcissicola]|uniref:Heterokaryon incompatibility domain-containing protein n=1 Tax=Botryotinia narcissicola TaxID=278944 RepID=A0A4Z1JKN5_9HELO|nr:hypothetical protein BOTNAR_0006g00300 [Botryotinia narcissicola]